MSAPDPFVVRVDTGDEIHALEWGMEHGLRPPCFLLVHGLAQTAWSWAPVARRLAVSARVLAPDLRGHGGSAAPRSGYDAESLAWDVLTVASAAGFGEAVGGPPVILAGHGTGAIVAAVAAMLAPGSVAGLALVDGGWEALGEATGLSVEQYVAALAEPPEVLRSIDTFLADRRAFDPATWDADQEQAARAQVDEKHAGHVSLVARPRVLRAVSAGLFAYDPREVLPQVRAPLLAIAAEAGGADDDAIRERRLALADVERVRAAAGCDPARVVRWGGCGHNVMRYRPDALAAELAALAAEGAPAGMDGRTPTAPPL